MVEFLAGFLIGDSLSSSSESDKKADNNNSTSGVWILWMISSFFALIVMAYGKEISDIYFYIVNEIRGTNFSISYFMENYDKNEQFYLPVGIFLYKMVIPFVLISPVGIFIIQLFYLLIYVYPYAESEIKEQAIFKNAISLAFALSTFISLNFIF